MRAVVGRFRMVQLELRCQGLGDAIHHYVKLQLHRHIIQRRTVDRIIGMGKVSQLEDFTQRCSTACAHEGRIVHQLVARITPETIPPPDVIRIGIAISHRVSNDRCIVAIF